MKVRYTHSKSSFVIENVYYVSIKRPRNFQVSFSEGRKQYSFLYTVSGTMRYSFFDKAEKEIVAETGSLVFIPTGTKHLSIYEGKKNTVFILQFDLTSGTLPENMNNPYRIDNNKTIELFYSIFTDIQSGFGNHPVYLLYRIYELFWSILQGERKIETKFRKLNFALQELQMYYFDSHKIDYYAYLCGMSESGFRRLFKEFTGLSPIEYRNRIRLQEAQKLLRSGEFSIEEVCQQVGFSNLSFFCRSYKHQFGHNPGKDK